MEGGDIERGAGSPDAWVTAQSRDPEAGVTRRQFLVGGGVLVAAAAVLGAVGWRSWTVRGYWYRFTGAYGPSGTPPPSYPVVYRKGTFPSPRLAEPAEYEVAYPPDVDPENTELVTATPVLICLPGRARSAEAVLEGGMHFGDFVADAVQRRAVTPFITVAVRAGDTYWHERSSGVDAMAVLLDEFIPFLRDDLGLGGTLGIMGWSMGGYGALRAAESRPQEFRAVCAVSAALWRSYDEGVGDAFDDAADYAADDVYAHAERLRGRRGEGRLRGAGPLLRRRQGVRRGAAAAAGGRVRARRPQRRLLDARGAGRDRLDGERARPDGSVRTTGPLRMRAPVRA